MVTESQSVENFARYSLKKRHKYVYVYIHYKPVNMDSHFIKKVEPEPVYFKIKCLKPFQFDISKRFLIAVDICIVLELS